MQDDGTFRFSLRLPDDLHARLKAAAEEGGRSLNAEMLRRLNDSFSSSDPLVMFRALNTLGERVAGLAADVRALGADVRSLKRQRPSASGK